MGASPLRAGRLALFCGAHVTPRQLVLLSLAALAGGGYFLWSLRSPGATPAGAGAGAVPSIVAQGQPSEGGGSAGGGSAWGAGAPGGDGAPGQPELTPEQVARRALIATQDAESQQRRRELFEANLASIDDAIEKTKAEGGNPEYIAALMQRRKLLSAQADAEEAEETEEAGAAE